MKTAKNNQQKTLALLLVLFMLFLYKETVWDVYFSPHTPENVSPDGKAATPTPVAQVTPEPTPKSYEFVEDAIDFGEERLPLDGL